jgi:hypothetical protein
MQNTTSSTIPFLAAYVLGALLSLTVAVTATWSDLEAAFYGFARRGSTPLQSLRCPVFLNRTETGIVSVEISNTTDRKLSPAARAEFSTPGTSVSFLESVEIGPGESKTVEWTIGPDNIDLQRFIFSNVYIFASYPLPDREGTCGTFIVNLPIPGAVMLTLLVVLGLAGMGVGWFVLTRTQRHSPQMEKALRPLTFLTIMIVLAMVVSLAGWWVQAILLLVVTLVTIVVTLNYAFFSMRQVTA